MAPVLAERWQGESSKRGEDTSASHEVNQFLSLNNLSHRQSLLHHTSPSPQPSLCRSVATMECSHLRETPPYNPRAPFRNSDAQLRGLHYPPVSLMLRYCVYCIVHLAKTSKEGGDSCGVARKEEISGLLPSWGHM